MANLQTGDGMTPRRNSALVFTNGVLAKFVRQYAEQKIQLAQACGAIWISKEGSDKFLVAALVGNDELVHIFKGVATNEIRIDFRSNRKNLSSFQLTISPTDTASFESSDGKHVDIRQRLYYAEDLLAMGLPQATPFGWVAHNRVDAIILANYGGYVNEPNYFSRIIELFVLKGQKIPTGVHCPVANTLGNVTSWYNRFWQHVSTGRIVRLSDRIRTSPGEVNWVATNEENYLIFQEPDNQMPRITSAPYYTRSIYDQADSLKYPPHTRATHEPISIKDWIQ
jgi:hypothetical protein